MTADGLRPATELAQNYAAMVASLTVDAWARPGRCAGWSVQDLVEYAGRVLDRIDIV